MSAWRRAVAIVVAGLCLPVCATPAQQPPPPQRVVAVPATPEVEDVNNGQEPVLDEELAKHQESVARIGDAAMTDRRSWQRLLELCDGIGHRLSGTPELDRALQWAKTAFETDGQQNVRIEEVEVTRWVRGDESLTMLEPRQIDLPILGLGGSVGTRGAGLKAEVVVVADERELELLGDGAKGKIVLFNNPMPAYDPERGTGYGDTVRFRVHGARLAAAQGAVGVLVRSVTARSLRSPHTGTMSYGDAKKKIPAAAVTTEDADRIARLVKAGQKVVVRLKMGAKTLRPAKSGNVIAEIVGREKPDEIVLIGAHIDSWDVGQGAHDDGTGVVMVIESLRLLRELGLTPRRTIRAVLFTNEENGLAGGKAYADRYGALADKHVAAIESDSGGFSPVGFSLDMSPDEREEKVLPNLARLSPLFSRLGSTKMTIGYGGADISPMRDKGVPALGLRVDMSTYFDIHHSHADTVDKVDPQELARCVATMATMAWLLAEMPQRLDAVEPDNNE